MWTKPNEKEMPNVVVGGTFLRMGFSENSQANCKVQTTHKKGSHEEHKGHKGLGRSQKPVFFFVPFVPFVSFVAYVFHDVTLPFSC